MYEYIYSYTDLKQSERRDFGTTIPFLYSTSFAFWFILSQRCGWSDIRVETGARFIGVCVFGKVSKLQPTTASQLWYTQISINKICSKDKHQDNGNVFLCITMSSKIYVNYYAMINC